MSHDNVSVRAVFLTSSGSVLLMKVAGQVEDIWIMPGGRIQTGESPVAALAREIREETGRRDIDTGTEIWVRHGTFIAEGERMDEIERFFLIPTGEFKPSTAGMGPAERDRLLGYKWWSIGEIVGSSERFVPRRLGELLTDLERNGPPSHLVETDE